MDCLGSHMDRTYLLPVSGRRTDDKAMPIVLRPSLEASWALLCACLAARSFPWTGASGLRVLAAWLVADVVCGCILTQLVALKRASLASASPIGAASSCSFTFTIPYAVPGSPGQRLAELVNGHVAQWQSQIWPRAGRCGITALVGAGLALVVATYLGRETLAVLSAGLLLSAALAVLAGRNVVALASWLGGLHLTLAWALGHLTLAPWRGPSMAVAVLIGLHAYARMRLGERQRSPALWLLRATWAILILALLVTRQPILAALVAMAALAEGMFYWASHPDRAYTQSYPSRLGWLLTMLFVALAAPYWP